MEASLSEFRRLVLSAVGIVAIFGIAEALAQAQRPPQPPRPVPAPVQHRGENFSAGKTPQQLFASDCSGCHRAPQGLAKNKGATMLGEFMREHYTNNRESAYALAAYLNSVRNVAPPPRVPPSQAPGAPGANDRPATASVPRPPGTVPEGDTPPAGEPPKPGAEQPRQPPGATATKRGARGAPQAAAKQLPAAVPEAPPAPSPPPPPKVEVPEIFD
jgi:hypothetical protein